METKKFSIFFNSLMHLLIAISKIWWFL